MMAQINADSMKLCKRIESLLVKATRDSDGFYDFAQENEEIVKYAFLARAVVRGLIEPLPEPFYINCFHRRRVLRVCKPT